MASTRKLAAIVFIDIVSYTAMMGKDEQAALRLLEELRKILYPLVKKHGGTVLKELGDGALMSFDSSLEAVNCAVTLQRTIKDISNLQLRIGIHLGDVVVEEKDVFGEGVNVAARVLPLAPPGGILVTEDVWKQAKNHPDLSFVSLGTRHLKGVSAAVKVFALSGEGLNVPTVKQRVSSLPAFRRSMIAATVIIIATASYLLSPFFRELGVEEVPSLAILYIKNLGSEAEEPYSYGITQDLIVDVAKAGLIRVAPMKDILSVQKSDLPIDKIAQQLRVRYVMEGSLRREADFFRLTAQIVEASTGKTLWADRIQTKITEAASLQGKIAEAILNALQLKPSTIVSKEITRPRTTNPEAYEFYLRAKFLFDKKKTKDDVAIAQGLYEKAIALDSGFVSARLGLGHTYRLSGDYHHARQIYEQALSIAQTDRDKLEEGNCLLSLGIVSYDLADYPQALDYYTRSLEIFEEVGDKNGQGAAFNNLGNIYSTQREHARAIAHYMRSLTIAQELRDRRRESAALSNIGVVYYHQGNYEKALDCYHKDLKISQELDDRRSEEITISNIGIVYTAQGEYEKALEYCLKSLKITQDLGDRHGEGITLSNIGELYLVQGEYAQAFDFFMRSLKIKQNLGDRLGESITLKDIGVLYLERSDYLQAIEYSTRALGIAQELGDRSTEGEIFKILGNVYLKKKEFRRSIESLKKASTIFREIDETQGVIAAISWLALAQIQIGATDSAQESVRKVEYLLTSVPQPAEYVDICWNLSQVYQFLGNSEKAKQYLKEAYNEITTRAHKITDKTMRQSYLSNVKTNRDIVAAWQQLHVTQ